MSRGIAFALMATTGIRAVAGSPARMPSAARPLRPGRLMSIRITSGAADRASSMPERLSLALISRRSGRRASNCATSFRLEGLSSTHSTVRISDAACGCMACTAVGADGIPSADGSASQAGSSIQNALPTPSVLCAPMRPPINSTSRLLTTRPMPVPSSVPSSWPRRLKGWNNCASLAGARPSPVSRTEARTVSPSQGTQSTVTVPPGRLYLMALDSRFTTTCFRRVRSARTSQSSGGAVRWTWMSAFRAMGSTMARQSASTSPSAIGSIDIDTRPDSMSDRSRISLISSSRYHPACRICSMLSCCDGVGAGEPVSMSCAKPRIALSGERSSWLMLDRNSDLARLARSAVTFAVCSSSWVCSSTSPSRRRSASACWRKVLSVPISR